MNFREDIDSLDWGNCEEFKAQNQIKNSIWDNFLAIDENFSDKIIEKCIKDILDWNLERFTEWAQSVVYKVNHDEKLGDKSFIIIKYNHWNWDKEYDILKYIYWSFKSDNIYMTPKPIKYVKIYDEKSNTEQCFLVMWYLQWPTFYQYFMINVINFIINNFNNDIDFMPIEYEENIKDLDLENVLETILQKLSQKNKKIKKLDISWKEFYNFKNIQDKINYINSLWIKIKPFWKIDNDFKESIKNMHTQMKKYLELQKRYWLAHNDLSKNYRNFIRYEWKLSVLDFWLSTKYKIWLDYSSNDYKILSELSNITS